MVETIAMSALRRSFLLAVVASLAVLAGCASVSTPRNPGVQTLAPTGRMSSSNTKWGLWTGVVPLCPSQK